MAMRILGSSPELTLIFDRSTLWLSSGQIQFLGKTLREVEGVESVETQTVWYRKPQIRVVFDSQTEPNAILRKMASALRSPNDLTSPKDPSVPAESASHDSRSCISSNVVESNAAERDEREGKLSGGNPLVRNRLREAYYGALTLGSFAMSWVGLIVPGIPTVPFVLLTAHFALQASPRLRERLLSSRMFGSMMRDWQKHRAIRRSIQIQAYVFTIVIIVVGFIFSPPFPALYLGMGIASVLGLYAISQIPVIEYFEDGQSVIPVGGFLKKPAVVV